MTVDERSRHELSLKLESALGPDAAETMMEMLPPVGWADVATKRDLDQLAVATKGNLDQLDSAIRTGLEDVRSDLRQLRTELANQARTFTLGSIGAIVTVAGLAFAAARIA
jgi:hypothetical protein